MVKQKIQKTMRWLIWTISFLLIIIVGFCIWQYPIPYVFFTQTVSDLGAIFSYTYSGLNPIQNVPNPISRWIFSVGFVLIAIDVLILVILYFKHKNLYLDSIKAIILIFFGIGALGTAIPWDSSVRFIHTIGTFLFVVGFALYNFVSQLLRYIRKKAIPPKKWWNKLDYIIDFIFVVLVFFVLIWYLIAGLLGLLHVDRIGWLSIFATGFIQKILLIVCIIAGFLLDLDDV